MDYVERIGLKVKNKSGEIGTIVSVDKYIKVDFGSRQAQFQKDAFVKGFLCFLDESVQDIIRSEIAELAVLEAEEAEKRRIADKIAAEERAKKAAEDAEARKAAAKGKKTIVLDDMFDADYHIEHLRRHPILPYQEVEKQFGIRISGFGRGINITDDAVILISSMEKKDGAFVYHDHWTPEGDYIYSGEGKTGDQKMSKGNKAIVDAASSGKALYLFVKLSPQEYYFQGTFALVEYTYEDERDEEGSLRKEYKFRLRKLADPTE